MNYVVGILFCTKSDNPFQVLSLHVVTSAANIVHIRVNEQMELVQNCTIIKFS